MQGTGKTAEVAVLITDKVNFKIQKKVIRDN